jgi:hypothetical protein
MADEIARRYGLWETRRVFDRGRYPAHVRAETRRLDEALYLGVYELDVALRREVEALLRLPQSDNTKATALRAEVEASAGRLAAAIDLAAVADQHHPHWAEIVEPFDLIRNEVDSLLVMAGSASPADG